MKQKKQLLGLVLATVSLFSVLTACNKNAPPTETEDEPTVVSDEYIKADETATKERADYEKNIKSADVLADYAGTLKPVKNIIDFYDGLSTEEFDEMIAYEAPSNGAGTGTYIFVGKLKDGADSNKVMTQLLNLAAANEDTQNDEIETSISGKFMIMAAAVNGSDISNKFALGLAETEVTSCAEAYAVLSTDLTSAAK